MVAGGCAGWHSLSLVEAGVAEARGGGTAGGEGAQHQGGLVTHFWVWKNCLVDVVCVVVQRGFRGAVCARSKERLR